MISEEQYKAAVKVRDDAQETINQYHREKQEAFRAKMETNPVFTEDELVFAAYSRCDCGYGLAYPKECNDPWHYWDCAGILMGVADKNKKHTDKLPFSFYNIRNETKHIGTTRGTIVPKPPSAQAPIDE